MDRRDSEDHSRWKGQLRDWCPEYASVLSCLSRTHAEKEELQRGKRQVMLDLVFE